MEPGQKELTRGESFLFFGFESSDEKRSSFVGFCNKYDLL